MKKIIANMVFILLCAFAATAENASLKGVVRDSKGEPVIGALIAVEGTSTGVMTDIDGKFTISVPSGKKLIVSCMSYKTATVDTKGKSDLQIVLEDDLQELDEVVVVGYGSMRKSDLTGAVSSVKIDEDDAARAASLDQMMQGKVAGMSVVNNSAAPDAGVTVTIRGTSSFNSSTEPLYVVDGVIINGSSETVSMLYRGTDSQSSDQETNGLMGINPQDIASVEVLKDASSTAIYGSEGANGVILITTKEASRDKPVINFNAGVEVGTARKRMDVMDFGEYVNYHKSINCSTKSIWDDEKGVALVDPVDWQEYSIRTAVTQRYYFSISGRPKTLSYFFSMGMTKNDGLLRGTGFETYNARLNLDKSYKKIKIGTKSSFSYTFTNMTQAKSGQQSNNASYTRSILSYHPYKPLEDEETEEDPDNDYKAGPDRWIKDFSNIKHRFRIIPSAYLEWNIAKWLRFKASVGGELNLVSTDRFKARTISSNTGTTGSISKSRQGRYNVDLMLLFNKKFKYGHKLSGTLGVTYTHRFSENESFLGYDYEQYKSQMAGINNAISTNASYSESNNSILSGLARAVYNYKDRYVLTSTIRADGSSRFMGKNKWGFFPSFAFAWRLNQEPWFKVETISTAKLRIGWGQVGNQTISNYRTFQTFSSTTIPAHYNDPAYSLNAIYRSNIPNPDLKWETTEQTNIGLDLGLWKGRLAISAEVYNKVTFDLLRGVAVAPSSGFSSISMNGGTIRNRGFEFTLDAVPLKLGKDFEWSIGGNIGLNRGEIISVGSEKAEGRIRINENEVIDAVYFYGSELTFSSQYPLNIFIEGQPMGLFYTWVFDGIVQSDEAGDPVKDPIEMDGVRRGPGYTRYKDLNGDGKITESDRCVTGNPNPDFTYGFNTNISWNRFSLAATFSGSYGGDIYNLTRAQLSYVSSTSSNLLRSVVQNAWTPENKSNEYPGLKKMDASDYSSRMSSRYIEDGSYLRLANLSLTYRIPLKNTKTAVLKGLSVGLNVKNLAVWTKYSGWDPEVNSYGTNLSKMGVDNNSYPAMRSYAIDVKFRF